MTDKKKRRNDLFLIVVCLVLAGAAWLTIQLTKEKGDWAVVMVNGEETARYSLSENITVRLETEDGGYNVLEIRDGYADITDASCPDKLCVRQHAISAGGETLVCLPNKTVVKIVSSDGDEVDVVG